MPNKVEEKGEKENDTDAPRLTILKILHHGEGEQEGEKRKERKKKGRGSNSIQL